ncbi:MAG TPA: hypothetical protein VFR85_16090 [Anaeromyxobacteraceae bacterium]|nr:hypothetical protein [Anaeromyxobacteraceae bacterium]
MRNPFLLTTLTLLAVAALEACGGSSDGGGGGQTCTPVTTATVTIGATGVSPKVVCVLPTTGTVRFNNADTVAHDIEDSGTNCPQLNLGSIPAGGNITTATFPTVGVCNYHDQVAPTNAAFQGTVGVTSGPVGGY